MEMRLGYPRHNQATRYHPPPYHSAAAPDLFTQPCFPDMFRVPPQASRSSAWTALKQKETTCIWTLNNTEAN